MPVMIQENQQTLPVLPKEIPEDTKEQLPFELPITNKGNTRPIMLVLCNYIASKGF
ncbi:14546_t:CDS:2 [Gigaspora rosea]|nr:14546_t:CDS:2 [Gigaspora rosea]